MFLVGDEKHRLPSYAPAVRAIFKTGGTRRNPLRDTLATSPAVRWRLLLRELRNMLLTARRRGLARSGAAPVFELPMGYFGLTEVDWVAPRDRPLDVFFAGSIEAAGGFTVRPRRPPAARWRGHSSRAPATAGDARRVPDRRTVRQPDGHPWSGELLAPADERKDRTLPARQLRRDVPPRRSREVGMCRDHGAVAGTAVHRGCPAVQLDAWDQLPDALERLLSDPDELAERATAMRAWWDEQLAEPAVARYIVTTLDRRAVPR